jgi:outer membrane biosynthesis protein TonB
MKLTKGKLSKLFHKKKQTMRRYKNQRKYRRASKTFRQRKPLNLHRSSMKKIGRVGGADPDEKVPLVVKPASDEETITTTEPVAEQAVEPVAEEPIPEQAVEPVAEEPVSEPAVEPIPEPVTEQAVEPVPEPVAEEPVSEPAVEPVVVEEPVPEEPLAKPVEEPIVAENVNPEPASTTPSVADALNIIADKIATAVVMKMRENPATGSSSNQDADIAVPLAVSAVVRQTQLAPEK